MLNTFVTVTLYDSQEEDIRDGCLALCQEYEDLLSRTKETSEVYKLNHLPAGERSLQVSEKTAEVIEKGLEYSRISEGAFDITIEPLSSLWNFTGKDPHVPPETAVREARERVGYQKVSLEGNMVTFADDDTTIDLGAIAKGFIADEMKDYLLEEGVESAIINLGGNVLCVGSRPDGAPFRIGIQRPFADRNEVAGALDIRDMSVVSSGVYERHFVENGVNYHHLLNPRTGYPYENGLIQVTIISPYSVDGDGLSTTCFALGLEEGSRLIESMENVYGIFMTEDGGMHYTEGAEALMIPPEEYGGMKNGA